MREIKFRAWDMDRREWLKDGHFYLGNDGRVFTLGYSRYGEPHTDITNLVSLVQYTGLKDKNGKEIYEGYIVTCEATQREINNVIEKYEKTVVSYEDGYFYPFGYNCGWRSSVDDIEVIGNIYENPELMQK